MVQNMGQKSVDRERIDHEDDDEGDFYQRPSTVLNSMPTTHERNDNKTEDEGNLSGVN